MISKVKLLKNIGKFYDYASKGDGLDWHKNTFIFAPNAYGKSTLVNVLRSLHVNDPKIVRARKTVSTGAQPEAIIIVDGVNHIFNGTKWDKPCSTMHIFDSPFIHANIYAYEIEYEHRKNIHRIIIGEHGVKLAQELTSLKSQEKDCRKHFEDLARKFRSAGFRYELEDFLSIFAVEEVAVAERIKKLEQDIKSKESEVQIRAFGSPKTLGAPDFNLSALKDIVIQKVSTIHEDAERRVLAHIDKNFEDKTQAKSFIQQGLDFIQADCPLCGQDLKNVGNISMTLSVHTNKDLFKKQRDLPSGTLIMN